MSVSWETMSLTGRQLVVSSLSGPVCIINAHASRSVLALKRAVEASTGIPVCDQRLLCGTLELDDNPDKLTALLSASAYNITLLRRDPEHVLWLKKLSKAGWHDACAILRDAPEHLKSSREIIKVATEQCYRALKFASDDLRADQVFLQDIFKCRGIECLKYVSDELRRNREFVLSSVRAYGRHGGDYQEGLEAAAEELWSDREFVLEVVKLVPRLIEKASDDLRVDSSIMLALVENSESTNQINKIIQSIPKQLLSNRNVVLALASRSCWILPHVPVELRAEIRSALGKEGHVSSAPSTRQAHRTGGVPRKAPSDRAPHSQGPASQWPLDTALDWLEPSSFKELRTARYCRQSFSKARRLRRGACRKTCKDTRRGNLRVTKSFPQSGKQQFLSDLAAFGDEVHEEGDRQADWR
mmetsp:Transcript_42870/g.82080  ORF Transcript_42870/g.82080 Transcript_42870/m.82080 type:complete len:414 (+) Transcript_42870:48-1289(+)